VKTIADDLIPKYHSHLVDIRVEYVFCEKTPNRGGKETWGTMQKITGKSAYLGADKEDQDRGLNDPFFMMTISYPVWETLSNKDRIALVDHELCHAVVKVDEETGDPKLGTVTHDVEEFKAVIERHGIWRPDVEQFIQTANKNKSKFNTLEEDDEDEES
jgi:hypothetical protein